MLPRFLNQVSFIPISSPSSDFKANLCKRNASPRWLCKIINTTFSSGYFCTVYVWIEHLCYVSTIIKNNKCSPISVRSINHVILYFIKASFDHIIITSIFYYPFVHERIQLQTSEQFSQKWKIVYLCAIFLTLTDSSPDKAVAYKWLSCTLNLIL